MTAQTFEEDYLHYIDERIRWHKRSADRTMVQFIFVRLGLVLASAALPALTVLEDRIWAIIASIFVAALTGLDTQFQWGEEWRHFRSTQLALERAVRNYRRLRSTAETGRNARAEQDIFNGFYAEAENLLQDEAQRFFKFRIAPWKSANKPAD